MVAYSDKRVNRERRKLRVHILLLLIVGLTAFGCRDEASGPVIYPVSGKVLVDGQPAAKAQVSFHAPNAPAGEMLQPIAIAEEDGSFRPSTRSPTTVRRPGTTR